MLDGQCNQSNNRSFNPLINRLIRPSMQSIHLSIHLLIKLMIYSSNISIHQSNHLSIFQSIFLSINSPFILSFYVSASRSIYLTPSNRTFQRKVQSRPSSAVHLIPWRKAVGYTLPAPCYQRCKDQWDSKMPIECSHLRRLHHRQLRPTCPRSWSRVLCGIDEACSPWDRNTILCSLSWKKNGNVKIVVVVKYKTALGKLLSYPYMHTWKW